MCGSESGDRRADDESTEGSRKRQVNGQTVTPDKHRKKRRPSKNSEISAEQNEEDQEEEEECDMPAMITMHATGGGNASGSGKN